MCNIVFSSFLFLLESMVLKDYNSGQWSSVETWFLWILKDLDLSEVLDVLVGMVIWVEVWVVEQMFVEVWSVDFLPHFGSAFLMSPLSKDLVVFLDSLFQCLQALPELFPPLGVPNQTPNSCTIHLHVDKFLLPGLDASSIQQYNVPSPRPHTQIQRVQWVLPNLLLHLDLQDP